MPMVAALGTVLVVGFLLWFAVGTQRNISRGNELLVWLQDGLPLIGARTTLRWFGSSAVQLDLVDVKPPFAKVQVNVVLEPRDLGWLWAWARRRGRRDFLILRATLPVPPRFDIEAGGRRGWTGNERLERLDPHHWQQDRWEDGIGPVEVAHSAGVSPGDVAATRKVWERLDKVTGGVWRLSVRNLAPHVEVHVEPPDGEEVRARDLIGTFQDLGWLVARDGRDGPGRSGKPGEPDRGDGPDT
jgi:hypothetical protein